MFCFKNYSTKKLIYSNNKRPEQFLKTKYFLWPATGGFYNSNMYSGPIKMAILGCKNLQEKVKKYYSTFRSMPPSFDGKIEKKFCAREKMREGKKTWNWWCLASIPSFDIERISQAHFSKVNNLGHFFFSSLQQNGVKIISEGSYDF